MYHQVAAAPALLALPAGDHFDWGHLLSAARHGVQAPPAGSPARERGRGRAAASGAAEQRLRCSVCKAVLPTPHLLDIHISELHDSFFAAQAARRLDVRSQCPSCALPVPCLPARRLDVAYQCPSCALSVS